MAWFVCLEWKDVLVLTFAANSLYGAVFFFLIFQCIFFSHLVNCYCGQISSVLTLCVKTKAFVFLSQSCKGRDSWLFCSLSGCCIFYFVSLSCEVVYHLIGFTKQAITIFGVIWWLQFFFLWSCSLVKPLCVPMFLLRVDC